VTRREPIARAAWFVLLAGAAASGGCDAAVTSVGAWSASPLRKFYFEAESGVLSGGFTIVSDAATSGGHYIEPPAGTSSLDMPGPAHARYAFEIASPARYIIWGRIHSPDAIHNTFWIQVDGGVAYQWRISTGEVWWWDRIHKEAEYFNPLMFDFDAGPHELVVSNSADHDGLDRFYITAEGDTPPGNDSPCNPPHSVLLDGGCSRSCGSQGGNLCGSVECAGLPTIPAYDCDICCVGPAPEKG
jgi:hypothetical protein